MRELEENERVFEDENDGDDNVTASLLLMIMGC